MKKHLYSVSVTVSLLIAMAVVAAHAGTSANATATIPFGFTAGSVSYPAGKYTIGETEMQGVLALRNARRHVWFISTLYSESGYDHAKPRLVFRRYGDRHFLTQVSFGIDGGRILPMSPAEREFLKGRSAALSKNELKPELVYIDAE
jgi:hypothetical protein